MEECPEQVSNHAENLTQRSPSFDAEAVLLLGDLLEVGAACADPRSSGWSCWPQEAPLGDIKGNSCSRLGNAAARGGAGGLSGSWGQGCGWPRGRQQRSWRCPTELPGTAGEQHVRALGAAAMFFLWVGAQALRPQPCLGRPGDLNPVKSLGKCSQFAWLSVPRASLGAVRWHSRPC